MRKPKNKDKQGQPRLQRFSIASNKPEALKREISTLAQTETQEEILNYGPDNAFPLRIAQAVEDSPAGSSCVGTIAQFIKGSGFSDKDLMKIPVDKDGTTLWELHSRLADSLALFWGFAVNLKFDERARITNAYQTSFENCRFKAPGETSPTITHIKYNPYYGTSEFKQEFTKVYPVFNIKNATTEIAGFKTKEQKNGYGGQIYYYGKTSPLSRFYPKPSYWSAKKWLEIDAKIQGFHAENLDNGFFQSVLMQMVGNPNEMSQNPAYMKKVVGDDGVERLEPTITVGVEFNRMMADNFSGYQKAGNVFVQWLKNITESLKIQEFPSRTNAELFSTLQDLTTKNITIATKVPSILANISEGVSLGSGGSEMQKAIELMQSNTLEQRATLENFYNTVLLPNLQDKTEAIVEIQNYNPISEPIQIEDKFWEQLSSKEKREFVKHAIPQLNLQDSLEEPTQNKRTLIEVIGVGGSQALMDILSQFAEAKLTEIQASNILQILFGVSLVDAQRMLQKEPVQIDQNGMPTTPQPATEEPKINENFRNLTGKQFQNVQRIVKKYNKGEITFEQASDMLKAGFGMSDEQINIWLVTPDEI